LGELPNLYLSSLVTMVLELVPDQPLVVWRALPQEDLEGVDLVEHLGALRVQHLQVQNQMRVVSSAILLPEASEDCLAVLEGNFLIPDAVSIFFAVASLVDSREHWEG